MTSERLERRLAAVLAADVAGYSRLMGIDEEGTLARLKAFRKTLVDPTIAAHRGRIVKTTGDGMLVEFASAVDAVRSAVEVQRGVAEQNATVAKDQRIEFRIGIHVGDIIFDENDIFGEGVNIAARLEGIAEPGGVCVSNDAYRQVRGKVEIVFDDMGPQLLKNIAEPMQSWRVRLSGQTSSAVKSGSVVSHPQPLSLPDKPSIAVLPFQNMSGDPEQEYFADGMVEDIITALSRFKSLFVIARNSSFCYKGKTVDIKQVGRELGVRYVLEGSVRKSGNRVRITGQLIDAPTGGHLWADRFDGGLKDIFDLQDQVTTRVVGIIEPTVEQAEVRRATRKSTINLDAYDYFIRGMARIYTSTKEGIEDAIQDYSKAIEIDPNFAAPYGWSTIAYTRRKQGLWMSDPSAEISEGIRLARKAIELGRDDAFALGAGGFGLAFLAGELDAALALTDRALVLNPNLANGWHASGWIRSYIGDPDTAIEHLAKAMRLSPLDFQMPQFWMATALATRCAGRFEESASWAAKVLQEAPDFVAGLTNYAVSSALADRIEEAQAAMSRALRIDPKIRLSSMPILTVLRRAEDRNNYCQGARLAGMPE
ncbi:adenylate/guanylate cyclase domain-containing protein [Bradyrhizobium erythrophlei]|uniref:Adenylate/guanylate cyclase n=1 Tax=Bradyrhizobium erythrophlei TaxID=1437360 RepID=A0A1M5U6N5_9BRAD|nr:adenylate/guanylate cyclase domain-containing protein [Bradyrhizobium erythrophlei]SHH58560.1 adenylate/guanylate cyclase [Bradyrhizobium erythrophlei]